MTTEQLKSILQKMFPNAGITVGYIGIVCRQYDDRCFRIFTEITYRDCWNKDARHSINIDQNEGRNDELSFKTVFHAISKLSELTGVQIPASFSNLRLLFS